MPLSISVLGVKASSRKGMHLTHTRAERKLKHVPVWKMPHFPHSRTLQGADVLDRSHPEDLEAAPNIPAAECAPSLFSE